MKNQDRYKTAQERTEAFTKFCQSFTNCEGCKLACKGYFDTLKYFAWLDLEAEEESFEDIVKEMRKRMIDREHSPSLWPFIDRLEAAHNKVARKCMGSEVKE